MKLVNLETIVFTNWETMHGSYFPLYQGTLLSEVTAVEGKNPWYFSSGPMSWDIKNACLPQPIREFESFGRKPINMCRILSASTMGVRQFVFDFGNFSARVGDLMPLLSYRKSYDRILRGSNI